MNSLVVQDKIWLPDQLGIHVDDVYTIVIFRFPRKKRIIPFLKYQENKRLPPGGVLPEILGGGVRPASQNPLPYL